MKSASVPRKDAGLKTTCYFEEPPYGFGIITTGKLRGGSALCERHIQEMWE